MNDKIVIGIHWSFWAIGAVALVWNVMGILNYFMQMNTSALSAMPETHRAIVEDRPAWATGGFAIAVFGGTLGCLLLLLRKSSAFYLFIASLAGVIVQVIHTVGIASSNAKFNPAELLMISLMPLVVAAFLIWYTRLAERKGWIKQNS